MPTTARIYFDFINNLYSYLFVCALVKNSLHIGIKKKTHLFFITIKFLYAIPATIPHQQIVGIILSLFTVCVLCYPQLKKVPIIFIKSQLFIIFGQYFIQFFHTIITLDFNTTLNNPYYSYCKQTICIALIYILYVLYLNAKRMRQLRTRYHHMFTAVIISISLALSYLTLFICQTQELSSPVIPMLFSALFILIAICINIYKRFIDLVEENMQVQIMLEQNKMTEDYSKQIETNLKELHSLRHDIRNHLITIDGYATQERYESIHDYISKITHHYTDVPLFDTPSNVVSALLNAKHQVARKQQIDFSIEWNFPYIHIEDFSIITILGNLIDNAITAAAKCEKGWITLDIMQSGSYLEIHMKNNHMESIREKNGEFQTSKEDDRYIHGLGIKNIRSTVEQLNGQIDINYTNEIFEVEILVPNY